MRRHRCGGECLRFTLHPARCQVSRETSRAVISLLALFALILLGSKDAERKQRYHARTNRTTCTRKYVVSTTMSGIHVNRKPHSILTLQDFRNHEEHEEYARQDVKHRRRQLQLSFPMSPCSARLRRSTASAKTAMTSSV